MAKIEKPQAVARLADILDLTDALMVARGDLGVEMPLEQVPGIQKQMTRAARRAGKPVVVATQMLESMIASPVPTRAEVSDVATAIFEGADAVMLSAESAAGKYPIEAVSTMNRIAEEVESDPTYRTIIHAQRNEPEATGADAIAAAARQIAETVDLAAIVLLALHRIADDVVGGGHLLEALFRCGGIARIEIGMQLLGQLAIDAANLLVRRVARHAQYLVGVLGHLVASPSSPALAVILA
jgi:hypothetical protein